MSIHAYNGAAGCGKTFSVFGRLQTELTANPLLSHQRVLAITFMHGARHRLSDQLAKINELKNRYEATTLDGVAWNICRRWTSRIIELGKSVPSITEFERVTVIAAELLAYEDVRLWFASSFPIIIVDEAQDLEAVRLQIVEELIKSCFVLLAFDEFQCLNQSNRPVAVTNWILNRCTPTVLLTNKRTNNQHLLTAALQVRSGQPVCPLTVIDKSFAVAVAPHRAGLKPILAATLIAYQFYKSGSFAVLTPTKDKSAYARDIVDILQKECIKGKLGPFKIAWENEGNSQYDAIRALIVNGIEYSASDIENLLSPYQSLIVSGLTLQTIKKIQSIRGVKSLSGSKILEILEKHIYTHRQHFRSKTASKAAMTIHQAKNREFDNVVIIWPFQISKDSDDRRRLLYNAITRAKKTCLIIVQSNSLLKEAPFV